MDGDAGFEKWEIKGHWKSRICPRRVITEDSLAWLSLFSTYRAGHLADAGGILDQPAIYISAMTYLDSVLAEANRADDSKS